MFRMGVYESVMARQRRATERAELASRHTRAAEALRRRLCGCAGGEDGKRPPASPCCAL